MSCWGRRLAWLIRELWLEHRRKKKMYDLWKKGRPLWKTTKLS